MIRFLILLFTVMLPSVGLAQTPPDWCTRIFVDAEKDRIPEWMGSGVLISEDLVITNFHVVENRKRLGNPVTVMFNDWTFAKGAKVIARSKMWDLAVIKIEKTDKTPIKFAADPVEGIRGSIHGYGFGSYETGSGTVGGFIQSDDLGTDDTTNGEHDDLRVLRGIGARQGDSGGAVTDKDGNLIGILNQSNSSCTIFIVQSQVKKIVSKLPSKYKTLKIWNK